MSAARTVYDHPDGFTLTFDCNLLIATDNNGKAVFLPIGPLGLVELGDKLRAIGNAPEHLAEQVGRELAIDALNECQATDDQGERFDILRGALLCLPELPHHSRATSGFAAVIVNALEIGISNLPKLKREVC